MSEAPFAAPGSRGSGGGERSGNARDHFDANNAGYGWATFPVPTTNESPVVDPIGNVWTVRDEPVAPEPAPIRYSETSTDRGRYRWSTDHLSIVNDYSDATLAAYPISDDDRNSYFPRALPDPVRDIGGARRVDEGSNLRRGWLGWLKRSRLSGFTWHLRRELASVWRDTGRVGGRTDTRSREDSE